MMPPVLVLSLSTTFLEEIVCSAIPGSTRYSVLAKESIARSAVKESLTRSGRCAIRALNGQVTGSLKYNKLCEILLCFYFYIHHHANKY